MQHEVQSANQLALLAVIKALGEAGSQELDHP